MVERKYIGGLDIVRFYAAALVLMFHFTFVSWDSPYGPNFGIDYAPHYPELQFFKSGWVGVEIFFVISGFVIAQSANGKSLSSSEGALGDCSPRYGYAPR
jgi:peptidoglycan/LPS O-acetylase OafA/YrhL